MSSGALGELGVIRGRTRLTYRAIASFYYPLALTSLIGLTVQPMLTFFMGRAPVCPGGNDDVFCG